MNRTDRLYALVEELRAAAPAVRTTTALAEHFEVATRTIKRDISALQQAGVPIWGTGGPGGGYAIEDAATLPPLTFTPGEATAVAIALASQLDLPFGLDGRAALRKVLNGMSGLQREDARALAARVWVHDDGAHRPPLSRLLEEAVRRRVVVVIDYVDRSDTASSRRPVEPMAFARTSGHWYLLAWCRRRRAGRWFRLDRVTGAVLTRQEAPERDLVATFGEPPPDAGPVVLDLDRVERP